MWEISTETVVAAAHQLRLAPGEGERLHGHNWRIKATVRASELDSRGFVLDFNELGPTLRALVEPYEHVFLNEIAPFDDGNGRVSRLAASHLIVRGGLRPPVLVAGDAARLREALESAFRLETEPLVALLVEASGRALDVMIQSLSAR
jgi:6-pyruvoyltetrahydropterin/6-carboxytetrahydropterin synthase